MSPRCSCEPPLNPLGDPNAEPGSLWQCPICDTTWRATTTPTDAVIVDPLRWKRLTRHDADYYRSQEKDL